MVTAFEMAGMCTRIFRLLLGSALICMPLHGPPEAAEGAASNYFPGAYGHFAVAVAPEPGPVLLNYFMLYGADVSQSVLQGQVNADLDTMAIFDTLAGLYTIEKEVLGARFSFGAFVPFGYAELDAILTGQNANIVVSGDTFDLGDISLVPLSLFWGTGNFHINLYEQVVVPTGGYSAAKTVNFGRNYWSFDTILALTWMNMDTGTEISIAPGIMANTRNNATDYKTGTEFHMDFMVNQFLSETFAVGVHGYIYEQLSADKGEGAILGDFKGNSVGLGPALLWIPAPFEGRLSVSASWLTDLDADKRIKSDYGVVTVALTF